MKLLTVLGKDPNKKKYLICQCACGTVKSVNQSNFRRQKSCGCQTKALISAANTKKGPKAIPKPQSKTYVCWKSMRARCENKSHKSYKDYGERGISVCDRWKTFANFLADMGEVPQGLQLGRIDNDKGYEPDNCRWETASQNGRNKRDTRFVEFNGERLSISEWAERTGLRFVTIWERLASGWSIEKTLTTPARKQSNSACKWTTIPKQKWSKDSSGKRILQWVYD